MVVLRMRRRVQPAPFIKRFFRGQFDPVGPELFGEEEARTYLGRFLFSGDDAYKRVSSLSGGERNLLLCTFKTRDKSTKNSGGG